MVSSPDLPGERRRGLVGLPPVTSRAEFYPQVRRPVANGTRRQVSRGTGQVAEESGAPRASRFVITACAAL